MCQSDGLEINESEHSVSGICGWINGEESSSVEALRGMLQVLAGGSVATGLAQLGQPRGPHAVGARGRPAHISLYDSAEQRVVIYGRPYWQRDEIAALARQYGAARAFAVDYQQRGRRALEDMEGAFSVAMIGPGPALLLATDRLGREPLVWARWGDTVVFGTRTDAVMAHPRAVKKLNPQSLYDYLFHHCMPAPSSILQGVQRLLPAQYVHIVEGAVETGHYWRLHYTDHATTPYADLALEFRQHLRAGVIRAAGDGRVGCFLSGGTDSSTVTGLLTEARGAPVDSFSIGFAAEGYDEIGYARITSEHFKTRPHEYYVTPADVTTAVPLIAAAYDEPFGNASAVPTYYCAKLAREHGIDTLLAGDGGDEIFGGNARYAKQKIFEHYNTLPSFVRSGMLEPLARAPGARSLAPLRKLASYIQQAKTPLPDRLETYNFLTRTSPQDIFSADFLAHIDTSHPLQEMRAIYHAAAAQSTLNRMLHLDLKFTLADNDLAKVSRMCALAGVEARYPLLDDALVAFAARLPIDMKVKGQQLRWFFKEALRDFLPPATLTKSKHGFGLPFGVWLTSHAPLHDLAYDTLRRFDQRGYFKTGYVDHLWAQHQHGHAAYYGVMIWVVMMLEQWLEKQAL